MIALFAGTDVDCGGYYPAHAKEAVESGKLDVRYINRGIPYNRESSYCSFGQLVQGPNETWSLWSSLWTTVYSSIPLCYTSSYSKYDTDLLESKEHIQLAEEASEQGIVLLKNKDNVLPLDKTKVFFLFYYFICIDQDHYCRWSSW